MMRRNLVRQVLSWREDWPVAIRWRRWPLAGWTPASSLIAGSCF